MGINLVRAERHVKHTRRTILKWAMAAPAGLGMSASPDVRVGSVANPVRPLRLLILGGTGFIGPHQVRYALARGHKVTLFNRGKKTQAWPAAVEELTGDRNSGDLAALEGREWDVCIDNPTTLPRWVRDVGGVLHGKVSQYVFISTVSVYAQNDKADDESAPVAAYMGKDAMAETLDSVRASGGALYGPLKAISEQEAQDAFPGAATIVRPGLIAGPGDETDRFTYWPVRLSRGGQVLAPGTGRDPVQFIDVRDLSEWLIRAAESRLIGTFNATGPANSLTMGAMLRTIRHAVHSDARLTWVPETFLDAHDVSAWSDLPVWVPGNGETAGFARRDISKAIAAGLTFRDLADTATATLKWFQQQPVDRQSMLKAGLSADRESMLLRQWKNHSNSGS